jgi:hypothetical protein
MSTIATAGKAKKNFVGYLPNDVPGHYPGCYPDHF